MLKINLKIAFRNLWKRKGFTLINILGLSVGLASCALIVLFVLYEYSYDQFFQDKDHIFRMVEYNESPGGNEVRGHVPYSFVGTVPNDYPEVEKATAISGPFPNQRVSVLHPDGSRTNFLENNVILADSSFFEVFSLKLKGGERNSVLTKPNSIVLTERTAKRFYGDQDPIGQSILISGRSSIVTGVCEDPPLNSHLKFSYLVSSTTVRWFSQENFNLRYAMCYFKLHSTADRRALESKFPSMIEKYLAPEIERVNGISWEEHQAAGNGYSYFLRPLSSIHLDEDISGSMKAGGNPLMLKVLTAVAFLIFCIACINFMNLSTVRSMERAKEVGIRKVMGSLRRQLIQQFLTEAFIISLVSVAISACLTIALSKQFNTYFGSAIGLNFNTQTITILVLTVPLLSLLSGMYPAFAISSYKPVSALKSKMTKGKNGWIKNGLMGFQFFISTSLIICSLVSQKQVYLLENKYLGYDKDQQLVIEGTFHMDANYTRPYLDNIKGIAGVKAAAGTLWVPGFQGTWSDEYQVAGSSDIHSIRRVIIGDEVDQVLDFEMVDGKFFEKNKDDKHELVINEAAVGLLNLKDPIGKTIGLITHDEGTRTTHNFRVKGVIKDFNFESLHNEVEPLIIQSNEAFAGRMSYITVKLDGQDIKQTINQLEAKWQEMIPERAFTYRFLDQVLDMNYRSDRTLSTVFFLFTSLSIIIAGVGLLALAAYSIKLRSKEISIRKVIGASVSNILILLSKGSMKVVFTSFVLAIPFSWFVTDRWLQNFVYRVDISVGIFLIAGVVSLVLGILTVNVIAFKAAVANPTDALKQE